MSDDEVMRFEITEDDLNNEFNYDLKRPKTSKNRATYGIWAEDSDEDDSDHIINGPISGQIKRNGIVSML